MKRVTFVFIGILIIVVSTILSQKQFEETPSKFVEIEANKKGIYD